MLPWFLSSVIAFCLSLLLAVLTGYTSIFFFVVTHLISFLLIEGRKHVRLWGKTCCASLLTHTILVAAVGVPNYIALFALNWGLCYLTCLTFLIKEKPKKNSQRRSA